MLVQMLHQSRQPLNDEPTPQTFLMARGHSIARMLIGQKLPIQRPTQPLIADTMLQQRPTGTCERFQPQETRLEKGNGCFQPRHRLN